MMRQSRHGRIDRTVPIREAHIPTHQSSMTSAPDTAAPNADTTAPAESETPKESEIAKEPGTGTLTLSKTEIHSR